MKYMNTQIQTTISNISAINEFEVDKFYYYKNTALDILSLSFSKFNDLFKLILQVLDVKYDEKEIDQEIIDILTRKGYWNSTILYFNNGSVIGFMKKYLKLKILRNKVSTIDKNRNIEISDAHIQHLKEYILLCGDLFSPTKDVILDVSNQTSKIKTLWSLLSNNTSQSIDLLRNVLNRFDVNLDPLNKTNQKSHRSNHIPIFDELYVYKKF